MSAVLDALELANRRTAARHDAGPLGLGRGQCRHRQDQGADRSRDAPAAGRRQARAHPLPHLHQGGRRRDAQPSGRASSAAGRMADEAKLDEEIEQLIDRPPEPAERVVGAPPVRARARRAGRHQHPHHPRLLPGAAEALPARGRRGAGLRGAGRGRGADPAAPCPGRADGGAGPRAMRQPRLVEALAAVAGRISIAEYAELMTRLLGERAWLLARIGDEAGLRRVRGAARRGDGLLARRHRRQPASDACLDAAFDAAGLRAAARRWPRAARRMSSAAQLIAEWLAAGENRPSLARRLCQGVLHRPKGGSSSAARHQGRDRGDARHRRGAAWRSRAAGPSARSRQRRGAGRTHLALLRLGLDIAGRYARAKRRRAALDYDDLIVATRRLLESADSAAWVLYKLDGGIDHVLVDEAQDTNPDQWEVIRRLTEEFFVGEGAVERSRTVFAVGDTKQSIFGFQRADPRKLEEMREWFAEQSRIAEQRLRAGRPQRLVPLDAGRARRRRLGVRRGRGGARRRRAGRRDASAQPQGRARPGRAVAAGQCRRRPRSTRPTSKARSGALALPHERLARLIAVHAKSLIGTRAARAQRRAAACRPLHGAGAPAQRVRECAGARAEARGESRWRASTA